MRGSSATLKRRKPGGGGGGGEGFGEGFGEGGGDGGGGDGGGDGGDAGGSGPLGDWCDTMARMCACSVVGALPSSSSRTQSLNSPTGSLTDTSLE